MTPDSTGKYAKLPSDKEPSFILTAQILNEKDLSALDDYDITFIPTLSTESTRMDLILGKDNNGTYLLAYQGTPVLYSTFTNDKTVQLNLMGGMGTGEFKVIAKHKIKNISLEFKINVEFDNEQTQPPIDPVEPPKPLPCDHITIDGPLYLDGTVNKAEFTISPFNSKNELISDRGGDITVDYQPASYLSAPMVFDPKTRKLKLEFPVERPEELRGTITVTMDGVIQYHNFAVYVSEPKIPTLVVNKYGEHIDSNGCYGGLIKASPFTPIYVEGNSATIVTDGLIEVAIVPVNKSAVQDIPHLIDSQGTYNVPTSDLAGVFLVFTSVSSDGDIETLMSQYSISGSYEDNTSSGIPIQVDNDSSTNAFYLNGVTNYFQYSDILTKQTFISNDGLKNLTLAILPRVENSEQMNVGVRIVEVAVEPQPPTEPVEPPEPNV